MGLVPAHACHVLESTRNRECPSQASTKKLVDSACEKLAL